MIRPAELENREASRPDQDRVFSEVELALIDALTRAVLRELRDGDGGDMEVAEAAAERQA